jgi:amino acid efflux transporter
VNARVLAALTAALISLGTANVFVAATSRLGYALACDGDLPTPMSRLSTRRIPRISIVVVGAIAGGGLVIAYLRGWGAETFLVVPNSLVVIVYTLGMGAGVRLLSGRSRALAALATLLCMGILPFAGIALLLPVGVATAGLTYRLVVRRFIRAEPWRRR